MIGFEIDLVATVALGVWGPAIVLGIIWRAVRLIQENVATRRRKKFRARHIRRR